MRKGTWKAWRVETQLHSVLFADAGLTGTCSTRSTTASTSAPWTVSVSVSTLYAAISSTGPAYRVPSSSMRRRERRTRPCSVRRHTARVERPAGKASVGWCRGATARKPHCGAATNSATSKTCGTGTRACTRRRPRGAHAPVSRCARRAARAASQAAAGCSWRGQAAECEYGLDGVLVHHVSSPWTVMCIVMAECWACERAGWSITPDGPGTSSPRSALLLCRGCAYPGEPHSCHLSASSMSIPSKRTVTTRNSSWQPVEFPNLHAEAATTVTTKSPRAVKIV